MALAHAVCLSLRKRARSTEDAHIAGGRDGPVLGRLFESQCHLPQVVGHMVGSTQQYSQSVPGRIFGVIFLGHGVVSLQPFVRRKIFKLREQFTAYLVPIFLELMSRRELRCFVRVGDENIL
jgi:hypothetical protein